MNTENRLYGRAVEFIALNDGPGDAEALDPEHVQGMMTVVCVSEIFGFPVEQVAVDVITFRVKEEELAKLRRRK